MSTLLFVTLLCSNIIKTLGEEELEPGILKTDTFGIRAGHGEYS